MYFYYSLAYGTALAKIAANNGRVIALDGDTKNSTYSDKLKKAFPERYIECFIAEQNLVFVAHIHFLIKFEV